MELYECFNLTISQNCGLRLTKLKLYSRITICKVKALISFPELEEFYFDSKIDINENKIKNFMDFKSLKKLRVFTGNKYDFFEIGNEPLERLDIYKSNKPDKKLIEKIISIKSLKNLKLEFYDMSNKDILKIKKKNNSLTDLKLFIRDKDKNNIIYNILDKFPNLKSLNIEVNNSIEFIAESNYRIIQSVSIFAPKLDEALIILKSMVNSNENFKKEKE